MLGDVATATASDWFRLTRQIGTKQMKTQVRLPVGGGGGDGWERLAEPWASRGGRFSTDVHSALGKPPIVMIANATRVRSASTEI